MVVIPHGAFCCERIACLPTVSSLLLLSNLSIYFVFFFFFFFFLLLLRLLLRFLLLFLPYQYSYRYDSLDELYLSSDLFVTAIYQQDPGKKSQHFLYEHCHLKIGNKWLLLGIVSIEVRKLTLLNVRPFGHGR